MSAQIAVIIAAYKGEATIARAVRSALEHPEAAEVVVVVDASPDGTAAAARAADDGSGRLQVIEQSVNQGPAAARNVGLAATRSDWVTVLDDDDYMQPGRLGRVLAYAHDQDVVADDLLLSQEGDETGALRTMWFDGEAKPQSLNLLDFVRANSTVPGRYGRELGFLKPLMRRAFLNLNHLRYDEGMRLGEDYDLYARLLAARARFLLIPAQGYVAVRRVGSLSHTHGTAELLALRAADERLLRTPLSPAERKAISRHRQDTDERYQWARLIGAMKRGNLIEAIACFFSDVHTSVHLIEQLWVLARRRSARA